MKKTLVLVLALAFLLAVSASAVAAGETVLPESAPYSIDTPYSYPVVPGTEEWGELKSLYAKIEACQVPEAILDNMTTEALFQTVLDYPLLGDMIVYDDPQMGFEAIREYCNGLQELWDRPDAEVVVEAFIDTEECQEGRALYRMFSTVLWQNLQGMLFVLPSPLFTPVTMQTPGGEWIEIRYDTTWADLGFTLSEAQAESNDLDNRYPDATKIRAMDPAYNCHSYTFYSTSSSNNVWIEGDQAEVFTWDGSFDEVTPGRSGDKVWYSPAHSGIYQYKSGDTVYVVQMGGFWPV